MVVKVLDLAIERKEGIVGTGGFVEMKVLVLILGEIVGFEGKTVPVQSLAEIEGFGGTTVPVQILGEIQVFEGTMVLGQELGGIQVFEGTMALVQILGGTVVIGGKMDPVLTPEELEGKTVLLLILGGFEEKKVTDQIPGETVGSEGKKVPVQIVKELEVWPGNLANFEGS